MSVVNNNLLLAAEDGGYVIDRSVRLRSSASAYFSRTPATTSSQTTWTWSAWVKRGVLSQQQTLFAAANAGDPYLQLVYDSSTNCLDFLYYVAGVVGRKQTTPVYRDPSSWYHVLVNWDTTNATASDRMRIYVNGTRVESFSISTDPAQNTTGTVNSNSYGHSIGRLFSTTNLFDGYLTEVNFIDGQALTPSSFGETDAVTGVWKPKKYAGTYGTNGFYLNFSNPASTTTIGADSSGNGNNWTSNNISVTAGATYDSMIDTPTPVEDERGNFCVLNPLKSGPNVTLSNGNLNYSTPNASPSGNDVSVATIGMSLGKWYCEWTWTAGTNSEIGIATDQVTINDTFLGGDAYGWMYYNGTGDKFHNSINSAYGATYAVNDVIGIAFDADIGTLTFYKNGVSQGSAFTGLTNGPYFFAVGVFNCIGSFNFGQRPFAYTPPSGFKALHTGNLPEPTIVDGGEYFNAVLDTGANIKTASEAVYTHQLAWIKDRANANNHQLIDSVRGTSAVLQSNTTAAETTYSAPSGNSVAWVWSSPSTGVTNTDGSITSTVSAGVTQGFSVVTYTGTANPSETVGHGLGVTPKLVIIKNRTNTASWPVISFLTTQSSGSALTSSVFQLSSKTGGVLNLNLTSAAGSYSLDAQMNSSGSTYVAYCFAEVPGYSRFGSYTGNGSADGPFIFAGFRPAFVMMKRTDATGWWQIEDAARGPTNEITNKVLFPNDSLAESGAGAGYAVDFVSNGFKFRNNGTNYNASGGTFIFACFAENPFKHSLAR